MNRRHFLKVLGGSLPMTLSLSAVTWLLARCGTSTSGNSCSGVATGAAVATYTNVTHSHTTVNMSAADVTAGIAGTYQVLSGDHPHTVVMQTSDFTTLQGGGTVTKTTDSDDHIVTLKKC